MPLTRQDYETSVKKAVRFFWKTRAAATRKNKAGAKKDAGSRGGATGGKNLDGFSDLIRRMVSQVGPSDLEVHENQKLVTLPGHFRPSKKWDIVIMHHGKLIAVLELKSLGGPSFGNNFNNRCEEAIGSGLDFKTAQREGAFGRGATPFLGFFILIHDAEKSRRVSSRTSINTAFKCDEIFKDSSYQTRMAILCERLMQESIYSSAATMSSPDTAARSGAFSDLSEPSTFFRFLNKLQAHIIAETSIV